MWSMMRPALVSLGMLTLITGIAYPLVVTGIAQAAFSDEAHGSVLVRDGKAVGSELVGQPFAGPGYFWSRPSATGPHGYNGAASSGSNAGPTNPALGETVAERVRALRDADPGNEAPVPVDLVTASGSGLDPHITPAGAAYQIERVARARGLDAGIVRELVDANTEGRQVGVLGEPRVNVVRLNLALDALK